MKTITAKVFYSGFDSEAGRELTLQPGESAEVSDEKYAQLEQDVPDRFEEFSGPREETPSVEVKEGNLIKDASDEVLVDILIGTITEVKHRELDLDEDELTDEQKATLVELLADEEGEAPAAVSYDGLDKESLEQVIEDRKKALEPEGSGKDGNVVKTDLVKALEACDAVQGAE